MADLELYCRVMVVPLALKVLGLSSVLACFSITSFSSVEGNRPGAQLTYACRTCGKKSVALSRASRREFKDGTVPTQSWWNGKVEEAVKKMIDERKCGCCPTLPPFADLNAQAEEASSAAISASPSQVCP